MTLLLACANDFGLEPVADPTVPSREAGATELAALDTAADEDTGEPGEPADTGAEPDEDSGAGDDTATDDPAPAEDCDHTSDLIYTITRDTAHLHTFDPATARFTDLGRVDCGTSQPPASMAVDRDGTAWIRYADDAVYAVDVGTLDCDTTPYASRRSGFGSFGMGYATNSADTWRDRLYLANDDTLAVADPATWALTPIGRMASQAELTGNADGELWAMLPLEEPARLAKLDKADGTELLAVELPGLPDPRTLDTFAFATWSGRFYLFLRVSGMGETTAVYEVTRGGKLTRILEDSGLIVVGAGVSTCAPA